MPRPWTAAIAAARSPSPGVSSERRPSRRRQNATAGLPERQVRHQRARSDRSRRSCRAGTCAGPGSSANSPWTVIVVPGVRVAGSIGATLPAAHRQQPGVRPRRRSGSGSRRRRRPRCSAAPRPETRASRYCRDRRRTSACWWRAARTRQAGRPDPMPCPSSATRISPSPPPSTSTVIRDRAGVDRVLDQLLDHRGRPLDHLAGGDPGGHGRRESPDHRSAGSVAPSVPVASSTSAISSAAPPAATSAAARCWRAGAAPRPGPRVDPGVPASSRLRPRAVDLAAAARASLARSSSARIAAARRVTGSGTPASRATWTP